MKILAHLDLDAFFAAVEELEDPTLRDKPLVVGGDPHGRGVVSTANYAARAFGIHSAMSAAEALRRCPHAVFLRPRHAVYRQYSRVVWDTVGEIVPRADGVPKVTGEFASVNKGASYRQVNLQGGVLRGSGQVDVGNNSSLNGRVNLEIRSQVAQDRGAFAVSGTVSRPIVRRGG